MTLDEAIEKAKHDGAVKDPQLVAWLQELQERRTPIPVILFCPLCNARHIDAGDFASRPHATHACQACGFCWRPSINTTVGVQFLPGFKDDAGTDDQT
jgi:rubredoxin